MTQGAAAGEKELIRSVCDLIEAGKEREVIIPIIPKIKNRSRSRWNAGNPLVSAAKTGNKRLIDELVKSFGFDINGVDVIDERDGFSWDQYCKTFF